ncbi:MAG: rhodanese-like domain-containing protein [Burkholderiales bacterium]|jgi:rhodanese-related sulfurtransferase|nr:rhodanese-like domain-containing protein [Burkholderiales bacterium]
MMLNAQGNELDLSKRSNLKPSETIHLDSDNVLLIDVRTQKEWDDGHIKGAIHLPLKDFKENLAQIVTDKIQPVVIYCSAGGRAIAAAKYMNNLGYHAVPVIEGGYSQMLSAGLNKSD